jgi:hypothetical protein
MSVSVKTLIGQMDFSTRRKRRTAVTHMVGCLERIIAAEQSYRDNIPPNLIDSELFDNAEEFIWRLDEVTDLMRDVYD